MAHNERPYDPYISSDRDGGNDRTAALQAQIDDTVNVMRQNIQRTSERGTHVVDLGTRADGMEEHAKQFNRGANRAMKNLRMKNWRMGAWIGLAIVIIVIIAIAIGVHYGKK